MQKVKTSELLEMYFKSVKGDPDRIRREAPDTQIIYAYEKELGKLLIDMNSEELLQLIDKLAAKEWIGTDAYMGSHFSYETTARILREVFQFYSKHYEPVYNPFYEPSMRGMEVVKRIVKTKRSLSWEVLENLLKEIHHDYTTDKADYIELIMRLFYEGFANAGEIVTITKKMVDYQNNSIVLPNKTIHLSERAFTLLVDLNKKTMLQTDKTDFTLVSWNDSYFKFIVRPKLVSEITQRTRGDMEGSINRQISREIKKRYGMDLNYKKLYMLGFYDYLVKKYGRDEADNIICSEYDSDLNSKLMESAEEYGVEQDRAVVLKKYLMEFVRDIKLKDDEA